MKIIYMGTPEFAVPALESIAKNNYDIPLVVTQEDRRKGRGKKLIPTDIKAKALELGLEVFQPENINSKESIEKLKNINPDIIIVTAYGQILKKEILEMPKYGCINIHASILPKYRGAAPINRAIMDGEKETGITIMQMEEGLDTGDILSIEKINIEANDDSEILHDKLKKIGGELIIKTLKDIELGNIKNIKQDDSKATYAEKIFKDTGLIDWNMNGEDLRNFVRGLKPWPSAYTFYKGDIFKIGEVELNNKIGNDEVGKVLKVSKEGIFVNGVDNTILIKTFQLPGKKMMKVEDYLRGNDFETGIVLG